MFTITEETKTKAVDEMMHILGEEGMVFETGSEAEADREAVQKAFDAAVKIVMAQFGL